MFPKDWRPMIVTSDDFFYFSERDRARAGEGVTGTTPRQSDGQWGNFVS
jgi:hypothetical protein